MIDLKSILEEHQKWLTSNEGTRANLSGADLSGADLSGANLSGADLSGANLMSQIEFINQNFSQSDSGIIAYKTFSTCYQARANWKLEPGSIISETVNPNRTDLCGCGINVAPLTWVKETHTGDVWQVLIRNEWLAGIVVPYGSDGKIRCERCELLEVVK